MGSKKIGKDGNGKIGKEKAKYGVYAGGGEIVCVYLEKDTAVNLFLALAQCLHYPTGKKKNGKKVKNGKKDKNGKKGPKPVPKVPKGPKVYYTTTGAPVYTAGAVPKGAKGYTTTTGAPGY